ncbi:MAG: GIN domain-containing protein [Allosphingosinicella sp.]
MNRIIAAALSIAAALAAALPAAAAERRYSVTDYDRVEVEGPYRVTLATGRPSGVVATGSQQALERVSIEVQGRTLRIRANRSAWGGYPGDPVGPVEIAASTRDLRAALVVGSGSLAVDKARGLRLDLSVSGSGQMAVGQVQADNLVVGLLGSGRIALGGAAKTMRATIQGSGDLDAAALGVEDLTLTADTAGTIAVRAARAARVTAIGAGDVRIDGKAACTLSGPAAATVACGR